MTRKLTYRMDLGLSSPTIKASRDAASNDAPALSNEAEKEPQVPTPALTAGPVDSSTDLPRKMVQPSPEIKSDWKPIGQLARALTEAAARRRAEREGSK